MRPRWLALPLLLALNASCTLLLLPDAGAGVREVQAVGSTELEGRAGSALAQPVAVLVVDAKGRPQPDVPVVFEPAGGGTVSAAQQSTNAQGQASTTWTLGPGTGAQTLTARLASSTSQRVTFVAQARPGAPARIQAVAGNGQTGVAGEELAQELVVRVLDAHDNPVPGATLTVTTDGGTATLPQAAGVPGELRFRWRLGTAARSYTLTVSGGAGSGAQTTFTATARAGALARIQVVAGNGQAGVVGERLPQNLVVRALDAHGNPIAGAPLTVTGDGGAPILDSAATGPAGELHFGWRLGLVARGYTVTVAGGEDGAVQAALSVTARAGAISELVVQRGSGQSVLEGATLPDSLVVRAQDAYGNPVSGAPVSWTVTAGGGAVSPGSSLTRADGTARAAWSVGIELPNVVRASVGDAVATFTATALPQTPRVWVPINTFTPVVEYFEIRLGDGTATPAAGQVVSIYYTAYRMDGTIFQRVRRGVDPPLRFQFNTEPSTVLRALNAGIGGMRRGGIRRILIPQQHTGGLGFPLYFEVELADFSA